MLNRIQALIKESGIPQTASLPLSECTICRPHLLKREGIEDVGTAILFIIPYYSEEGDTPHRNCSLYAVPRDYHLFIQKLAESILPRLRAEFPNNRFALFSDHSPIDERTASARAGLGVIGKNGLLITKEFSSLVFLGELITDAQLAEDKPYTEEIPTCENCGACLAACPLAQGKVSICLSQLTQKKGTLSEEEKQQISTFSSAWGCDICQEVCPHTKAAKKNGTLQTPLPFFREQLLPCLTYDRISGMTDQAFSERAYAWRGRTVILRNLSILEQRNEQEEADASNESRNR